MLQLPKNEYRISITSGCNMKCVYCHNEGNKVINQLSKDDIEELIKNSYDLGLEQVRLTGGEPLIHKEIFDICQMLAEKYHLKVGINTNIIEIDKLMYMIEKGWIYRVVVGLDYFDAPISKQSPIGISSKQALENKVKQDKMVAQYKEMSDSMEAQVNEIKSQVDILKTKLEEARSKQAMLVARSQMADAKSQMAKTLGDMDSKKYRCKRYYIYCI